MKSSRLFFFIMILMSGSGSYGTYSVDEAFEQMSHSSPISAVIEEVKDPVTRSAIDPLMAAASSYGGGGYGGGGHGGGGYGGGGHGGGYGGGGGYGHGSYLNNSAVGLLGFLYLLNLIQDIINALTTTTAGGKRRKKSAENSFQDWITTLGEGGVQSLQFEVASTIIPLVSEFTDHSDNARPLACVQRSVCSANRRLTSNYGQLGKIFAKMSSEAVLEHFNAKDGTFSLAGIYGRNLSDCHSIFDQCKLDY